MKPKKPASPNSSSDEGSVDTPAAQNSPPDNVWAFTWAFVTSPKLLAFVLGALLLAVIGAKIGGVDVLGELLKRVHLESGKDENTETIGRSGDLIGQGKKWRRPYVLDSVLMHIQIENVTNSLAESRRHAKIRTFYNVTAISELTSEKSQFPDWYSTSSGQSVHRSHGTETEKLRHSADKKKEWDVFFALAPGQSHILMTGAAVDYHFPLKQRRDHEFELRENEELECYENTEDVIGEFVMVIESASIPIRPNWAHQLIAKRKNATAALKGEWQFFPIGSDDSNTSVIVARWRGLEPGDSVAAIYTW